MFLKGLLDKGNDCLRVDIKKNELYTKNHLILIMAI